MIDEVDRGIILATQDGLPLVKEPYHHIAETLGIAAGEVMARMEAMKQAGIIRRIGVVPNHYMLGYRYNGMTVWDVDEEQVNEAGERLAALDFVSHCYHRPRRPPHWPYTLFAMIHARDEAVAQALVDRVADALGDLSRGHQVLYSTRILKKTGLRLDLTRSRSG